MATFTITIEYYSDLDADYITKTARATGTLEQVIAKARQLAKASVKGHEVLNVTVEDSLNRLIYGIADRSVWHSLEDAPIQQTHN